MAYQITLTANQEIGLAYAAAQVAKPEEAKPSSAQYLQARVGDLCDNYFKQSYAGRVIAVKAELEAKPEKIAEIEAALAIMVKPIEGETLIKG